MAAKNEAKVKFIADTEQFREGIKNANTALAEQRSALKLNTAQMKLQGESAELLTERNKILKDELEANRQKQQAVNGQLEAAVRYYGENSKQAADLRVKLNNLKTQEAGIEKDIADTNTKLKAQADAMDNAGEAAGDLDDSLDDVDKAEKDVSDGIKSAGDGFTVFKGISCRPCIKRYTEARRRFARPRKRSI